jgi:aspartate-semialdehyde dehydrogenase
VAVLGSSSNCGSSLRQALAEFGMPGSRVDLYNSVEENEPVISEYDGEARLIQQPSVAEIASRDLIFLCERGEVAERVVGMTSATVIDLADARPGGARPTVVHMDINPEAARDHHGILAVPHQLSTLLSDLLYPLERTLGCVEVVAMVLRPAADFGEPGVEELRQQTVRLLNFTSPPSEVLGRQLAFNLVPQSLLPDGCESLEQRVPAEVGELLGWGENRLAIRLVGAPVFYGHTAELRVRFAHEVMQDRVREILEQSGLAESATAEGAKATPMDVSNVRDTCVAEVVADGTGGFWLSALSGEAHVRGAELAVRLAGEVCDL